MTQNTNSAESVMDHNELLIRIDERTKHLATVIDSFRGQMVTQGEFKPVRMIAYGLTGVMVTAIVLAIVGSLVGK